MRDGKSWHGAGVGGEGGAGGEQGWWRCGVCVGGWVGGRGRHTHKQNHAWFGAVLAVRRRAGYSNAAIIYV